MSLKTNNRNRLPLRALILAGTVALASNGFAATVNWSGNSSNDFNGNGTNWTGGSVPSLSADTWQINGPGTQGNTTLSVTSPLIFTATAAKISFGGTSNMTLTGSDITIFGGTADAILAGTANKTTTINNNIIVGNGSATTSSLTSNVQDASLVLNGNIAPGTGGTAGTAVIALGSTGTKAGNYTINGNISLGGATGLSFNKRGNGTATFNGNSTITTLTNSEAGKIVIAGGTNSIGTLASGFATTQITGGNTTITTALTFSSGANITTTQITGGTLNLNMADATSGWGTATANNTVQISGGIVNTTAGRGIKSNLTVDGGTLNFNTGASRFSLTTANATFTLSSGAVNFNPTTGFGVRFGGDNGSTGASGIGFTGVQSGGTFTVNGVGGSGTTFSLGSNTTTAGANATYSLSGGTLNVKGTNSTNGRVDLGADAGGNNTTIFTLSGTGKLVIEGNTSNSGIFGSQTGATQVLSLQGGTLVTGNITATNLRGAVGSTNGTIENNGTKIAPGDTTNAGRTRITGNLSIASGVFDVNIGGTTAAVAWQEAASSGKFDNMIVSNNISLGGTLTISLIDGYTPAATAPTYQILSSTSGTISGTFSGLANGSTFTQAGQLWLITYGTSAVTLTAIPEPSQWAVGIGAFGVLAILARRRQRKA